MEETEILTQLKKLERETARQLSEIRKSKRAKKPSRSHTGVMREFMQSRKLVGRNTLNELILIDRTLDKDHLSTKERKTLKFRRKKVLSRLTLDKK